MRKTVEEVMARGGPGPDGRRPRTRKPAPASPPATAPPRRSSQRPLYPRSLKGMVPSSAAGRVAAGPANSWPLTHPVRRRDHSHRPAAGIGPVTTAAVSCRTDAATVSGSAPRRANPGGGHLVRTSPSPARRRYASRRHPSPGGKGDAGSPADP